MRCKHIDEELIDKHREAGDIERLLQDKKTASMRGYTRGAMIIFTFKCKDCGRVRQQVIHHEE